MKDKLENALNECRILILGAQVVIGFQYQAVFQNKFDTLSHLSQYLNLASLLLMLVALALLMAPAPYHRIVEGGEDTDALHDFTTGVLRLALLPFAIGVGMQFSIATERVWPGKIEVVSGVLTFLIAIFFWYGLRAFQRYHNVNKAEGQTMNALPSPTPLKDKIKQVLMEARMVLPGAQALLGFQFVAMLTEGFDKLSAASKYVHLASLFFTTLCTILLMTPAAYHRVVEAGENTERFHHFAGRMVIAATVFLSLGVSGDLFVVSYKIAHSVPISIVLSLIVLLSCLALWLGYPLYLRKKAKRFSFSVRQAEL